MNFSIRQIIRRLLAPQHKLACNGRTWRRLLGDLRARGGGERESGAFLLGRIESDGSRTITDYALYDDIDPHALDTGIVRLDGRHFGRLWEICEAKGLAVVADVHVHPGGEGQSSSDKAHPIISRAGHIALIVPHFAAPPVRVRDVGIHRYLGDFRWESVPKSRRSKFLFVGT